MPYENLRSITVTPVAANVINSHRFLAIGTGGEVDEATSGADAIGVSLEGSPAASGAVIPMAMPGGKVLVEAGDDVVAGTRAMSDATGRAIPATGATARVLGFFEESGAVGELVTVIFEKAAGEFVA